MRSEALLSLLPLLATLSTITARPHSHHHDHHHHPLRKSLGFGPSHDHASFETLPIQPLGNVGLQALKEVDVKEVARKFIQSKIGEVEGEGFYLRDDTYTDSNTGITHVYAKQILHGLEVSDGDINLNVDRYGRILSWGNSFLPSESTTLVDSTTSGETEIQCASVESQISALKAEIASLKGDEGAWGIVKAASRIVLGSLGTEPKAPADKKVIGKLYKQIKHLKHHKESLCSESSSGSFKVEKKGEMLTPVEALLHLLPKLHSDISSLEELDIEDFHSVPEHSLVPKAAPAEPPTEHITGSGLSKAGIKSTVPARLMYTQTSSNGPRAVWKLEVELKDNWYEAYVDVLSGELIRIVDWAKDYSWGSMKNDSNDDKMEVKKDGKGGKQKPLPAPPTKLKPYTYGVFPWGVNDPTVGNYTIVEKPWDEVASSIGWHEIPTSSNPWSSTHFPGMSIKGNTTTFYTTAGNNVIAHEDWEGQNNYISNYRPVNDSMVFVYDYGEFDGLAPKEYIDMVVTQLFYTSNMYHDLLYRLGFDEVSGNFQAYNFGLGGKGGDPVTCNAQDGSGYNNANFMTPPDGQAPRMRMYVWDTATPFRDGDVEAGIVIHEYSHGLSTRLTGGPMNSGCLGFGEAGGMGEGWGDAIATLIRQIVEHKKFKNGTDIFSMGSWAANRDAGIRNYKYSTNSTANPSTYKTLDKPGYWGVHAIGEVWAEFLFVMSQRLVEKYGFSPTLFPPTNTSSPNDYYTKTTIESVDSLGHPVPLVPKHGNTLALQLIISAMKIQPCRPSFFDARDAIIQSDDILTGGENRCLIWKAFAERGLGNDAKVIGQTPWGGGVRTDGFSVPVKACQPEKAPKGPKEPETPKKPKHPKHGDEDEE